MMIESKTNTIFFVLEFLLMYAVSSTISTALYSISIGILFLISLYEFYKTKKVIHTDRLFNVCYYSFFFLILIASLAIHYTDSLEFALKITQWSVITFVVIYYFFQRHFFNYAIIGGIALGVWTICLIALYQFYSYPLGMRIAGYFAHPNKACIILVLSVPFLTLFSCWGNINKKLRAFFMATVFVTCIVIAMTGSRGGIIGLCLGAIIFLLIQTLYVKKRPFRDLLKAYMAVFWICICIGSTYGLIFYHNQVENLQTKAFSKVETSNKAIERNTTLTVEPLPKKNVQTGIERSYDGERILMWKSSWEMWKDHKIIGVGLKHWNQEYINHHYILPGAKEPTLEYPHNIFATFFSMTGLVGGIGILLFTLGMFIYLCRLLKHHADDIFLNALLWSMIAITLQGLVDISILYRYGMILYSAYLGIGLASIAYTKRMQHQ